MAEKKPQCRTRSGAKRNAKGQFEKGTSGNPGGKKKLTEEEKKAIDALYEKAWPTLVELMNDIETPPRVRVDIAKFVIEQKDGKATQRIAGEAEGAPVIAISMIPPDVTDYVG